MPTTSPLTSSLYRHRVSARDPQADKAKADATKHIHVEDECLVSIPNDTHNYIAAQATKQEMRFPETHPASE